MRFRSMRLLYAFIIFAFIYSCTDSDSNCSDEEFDLIGNWRLVEFCFSPGDASCPIRYPEEEEIISFRSDSTYKYSIGDQSTTGTFSVSGNRVDFDSDSENPSLTSRILNPLSSCRLEINPQCIEECRSLFEKVD